MECMASGVGDIGEGGWRGNPGKEGEAILHMEFAWDTNLVGEQWSILRKKLKRLDEDRHPPVVVDRRFVYAVCFFLPEALRATPPPCFGPHYLSFEDRWGSFC